PTPPITDPIPDPSPQELWGELRRFLSGQDPAGGSPLTPQSHARCALLLLRCLPPARRAALQHLRGLFDQQVRTKNSSSSSSSSSSRMGVPPVPPSPNPSAAALAEVIQEVQLVLAQLLDANPKAWAPVISSWAIELMGHLSSKYAGRHGVPHSGLTGLTGNLNELLQLWMGCGATRALMDIYSQCLAAMSPGCPDSCVDALLDTSLQHSPHFDWVVAHIGSSFPSTIIHRVLSCGLKDFSSHGSSQSLPSESPPSCDKRLPKIASVVGILGHLASRHSSSIKQELLRMFHDSLLPPPGAPGTPSAQQTATVPFLLQLALMSPQLVAAVAPELVESLDADVLNRLQRRLAPLPREELEELLAIAVRLVSQSSTGTYRLLQFLLDTAMPPSVIITPGPSGPPLHEGVREACDRLLQLLLLRLQQLVYSRSGAAPASPSELVPPARSVPFLDSLRPHVQELCVETLRLERKRFLWQHQLLVLLGVYAAPHGASDALVYLLTLAKTQEQLQLAAQLHAVLSCCLGGDLLPDAIDACVRQIHAARLPDAQLAQLCRNLALLVRCDASCDAAGTAGSPLGERLAAVLWRHLPDWAQLLLHRDAAVAEAACQLLAGCPLPQLVPAAHLLAAVRAAVHHFFTVLRRPSATSATSTAALSHSGRLLARLSAVSPAACKAVVQQLVEAALCGANAQLFGAEEASPSPDAVAGATDVSLLEANRSLSGVWAVFHAGIIGCGLKPLPAPPQRLPDEPLGNSQLFLNLLLRCCCNGGPSEQPSSPFAPATINPEAAKAVAVALVESVCPEVATGELVWAPDEAARGTVERDLRVCRRFRSHPLLFSLLRLVAAGPPALCYCAVILRGLLGSLVAYWEACRATRAADSPWQLWASATLVATLAEGSVVPPALGAVAEVLEEVAPYEVHLLLLGVWDYLRENGPLPQKFQFQPQRGVFRREFGRDAELGKPLELLQHLLQKNIERLGPLAGRFR
ncbi:INT5 protein, partial [Rhinopomastus cyanomelas]|nr:INT5 protein [Rhinopomastus cyanomelas]